MPPGRTLGSRYRFRQLHPPHSPFHLYGFDDFDICVWEIQTDRADLFLTINRVTRHQTRRLGQAIASTIVTPVASSSGGTVQWQWRRPRKDVFTVEISASTGRFIRAKIAVGTVITNVMPQRSINFQKLSNTPSRDSQRVLGTPRAPDDTIAIKITCTAKTWNKGNGQITASSSVNSNVSPTNRYIPSLNRCAAQPLAYPWCRLCGNRRHAIFRTSSKSGRFCCAISALNHRFLPDATPDFSGGSGHNH